MPTITVEDGSIVSGANSYISIADADTYFASINDTTWTAATVLTAHKQVALLRAMPYLEELSWRGITVSGVDQPLQWPRSNVYDRDNYLIDDDYIPNKIQLAQCEAAVRVLSDRTILQPDQWRGGKVISTSIAGATSSVYKRTAPAGTVFTAIKGYLKGYLNNNGTSIIRS